MRTALTSIFILPFILPFILLPAHASAQEPERDWWYWCLAGSVHEAASDWPAAAADWHRATTAEPGFERGWYQLGIARIAAGEEGALEPLQRATEFDRTRAGAHLALLRLHAGNGENELAERASQGALDSQLYATKGELKRLKELRAVRNQKWFRDFERRVTKRPLTRIKALADAKDPDALTHLVRSLAFHWRDEKSSPVWLMRELLDAVVDVAQRGKQDSDAFSLARSRASRFATAIDAAFGSDSFVTWSAAIVKLDAAQRAAYRANWKAIDAVGPKFRGHRFKLLMKSFVPIEKSVREMGDTLGTMLVVGILTHTRECLVEYKVQGYELEAEWRRSWQGMKEYLALATALGEHDEANSAYEDRLFLCSNFPKGADELRAEFYSADYLAQGLIEMTINELAIPVSDREISWTKDWMKSFQLYP